MPVMQTLNEQRVPVLIWTNDIEIRAKEQLSDVRHILTHMTFTLILSSGY